MAAKKEQAPQPDVELVTMIKDGETIAVHPTTVAAHEKAGWKVKA